MFKNAFLIILKGNNISNLYLFITVAICLCVCATPFSNMCSNNGVSLPVCQWTLLKREKSILYSVWLLHFSESLGFGTLLCCPLWQHKMLQYGTDTSPRSVTPGSESHRCLAFVHFSKCGRPEKAAGFSRMQTLSMFLWETTSRRHKYAVFRSSKKPFWLVIVHGWKMEKCGNWTFKTTCLVSSTD